MTEREAPADIVIELARKVRMPKDILEIYLNRMNMAVMGQVLAYREIVGPGINEQKETSDTQ